MKASAVSPNVFPLPCGVNSPLLARRYVEQFAADRALDGATGALCVIVSELVTNAIVHGAPPIELALRYEDGEVTIEVSDGDPNIENVRLRAPGQVDPGGRGLRVIASLADRWGTRPSQSGKVVWATM